MPYKKYALLGIVLVLALSSCKLPYPDQSPATTPNPTSLFANEPQQISNDDQMATMQADATLTALALPAGGQAGATPTPSPTLAGGTPVTPVDQVTVTGTPIIVGIGTLTPTATTIVVGGPTQTAAPATAVPTTIVGRPATYTLQKFEFVYCIARRFNVDPDQLLTLSGLTRAQANYLTAGTVLTIPQSGSFPGERALRPHPATYTVTGNDDTNIHGVACKFGDVDPALIAQLNGLPISATLTVGQAIKIP